MASQVASWQDRRLGSLGRGLRERAARNGAERSWRAPKSPRVLPRQGMDDESFIRAVAVASIIGTGIAILGALLMYGAFRLVRHLLSAKKAAG